MSTGSLLWVPVLFHVLGCVGVVELPVANTHHKLQDFCWLWWIFPLYSPMRATFGPIPKGEALFVVDPCPGSFQEPQLPH
ncbi:hypothetical protein cgR_5020 [Corynebacterium glutamicum R]|uniref:Secreted protein n=1 Tax=Corynebacterium glutamicum (strain R) TaxID=340322 RepID=A0AB72VAQ0_CORGB|nr:hypothetical protein cgR_5020 [Corynebacterium glutamicum R]